MIRAALLACVLACTAPAAAQAATGSSTLTLGGGAHAQLRAAGVAFGALAPATRTGRSLTLPAEARTADPPRVVPQGGLRLRKGRRGVALTGLRIGLGALPGLSARVGGKRRALATVRIRRGGATIDAAADTLRLTGAKVVLTRDAGRLLKRRLHLRKRPAGRLGTLAARAAPAPPGGPGPDAPAPGQPGAPGASTEPAPLARPATAVAVTAATLGWHVRESFVRYIASGEGASAHDGAVAGDPVVLPGTDVPLVYDFAFPFADGWYDPVSGCAAVRFAGRVRFGYAGHGILIDTATPEIELDGPRSRAVMRINGRREVLVDLQPGAPAVAGTTRTYAELPGTIPAGTGETVFAGFYLPGDPFGRFALSFTT